MKFLSGKIKWFCILNPLLIVLLTYFWSCIPISFEPDNIIFKYQSLFKHSYIKEGVEQRNNALEEVFFIDVSGDKTFVEDSITNKRTIITDRNRLATFFGLIKNAGYKYIICDLIFDYPAEEDGQLKSAIDSLQSIAFAIDHTQPNKIDVPYGGTTGYEFKEIEIKDVSENILKFRMVDGNSDKTLPLAVYEATSGNSLYPNLFWLTGTDHSKRLNYQKLDAYITIQDTIPSSERSVSLWYLHDILNSPDVLEHYVKDKVVVIGDFKSDIIDTSFGKMPGSMVQYNLFKNIENNNSQLKVSQVIYLFITFAIYTFILTKITKKKEEKESNEKPAKSNLTIYFLLLLTAKTSIDSIVIILISSISYWFFNFPFEVMPLVFWLFIFRYLIRDFSKWKLIRVRS